MNPFSFFDIHGQTAVITGGSGVLGSVMARALAQVGAKVAILGLHEEKAVAAASAIPSEENQALGIACDVLDRASLEHVLEQVTGTFGPIDILVNAAGGNSPQATTSADVSFLTWIEQPWYQQLPKAGQVSFAPP